jgi:hypothetical protein
MIDRVRSTWLKRASLAIALFAAGAVVGDFVVRGSKSQPVPEVASAPVQVIHKRKVRTVHVHPRASAATGTSGVAPAASASPASTATATPVSSRTSPGAVGGAGGGEGGESEHDD